MVQLLLQLRSLQQDAKAANFGLGMVVRKRVVSGLRWAPQQHLSTDSMALPVCLWYIKQQLTCGHLSGASSESIAFALQCLDASCCHLCPHQCMAAYSSCHHPAA